MLYVDYRTYNFKKQYTNIGQTQESKTYRLCEIAKLEAHAKSLIYKQPFLASALDFSFLRYYIYLMTIRLSS